MLSPRFDEILVIPNGQPWLRENPPTASAQHRLEMCSRALSDLSEAAQGAVALTDIEINRDGPTYTFDTVTQLSAFFPKDSLNLILGSDAARGIDKWHKASDLRKMVEFLVVRRPGEEPSQFSEVCINALDISATQVRHMLEKGEDVSPFISPSVLTYIQEHKLYGSK